MQVSAGAGLPPSAPHWAEGLTFRVPQAALRSPTARDAEELRMLRAYTEREPLSSRLPVSYQMVPTQIRTAFGSIIGRWKRRSVERWAAFPAWPLDLSADLLADMAGCPSAFAGGPTPVVLTHDLDSPEGLDNLVGRFLDVEEAAGARSASYVVPCAWPLDHGLLEEVKRRGHELGIHGYDHSNRTPYLPPTERKERLAAAAPLVERYGMIGYRAPSLVRTRELLRDLNAHFRYDSSIPTSGGLFPVPNNGCASARPFRAEGMAEIPVSLPRDGSLRFLGMTPEEMLAIWIDCAEKIARSGGVVVLLTHCEERFSGSAAMFAAYRRFLEHIARDKRFAWSTPSAVLDAYLRSEARH